MIHHVRYPSLNTSFIPRPSTEANGPIKLMRLRRSSTSRLCSESTFQCAFLRRYSSRAPDVPAPVLPVFNDIPFRRPRRTVMINPLFDQKNRPLQSSRDVTAQTAATRRRRPIDFLHRTPTLSTLPEDHPVPNPPNSFTSPASLKKCPAVMPSACREDSLFKRVLHFYMSSPRTPIQSLVAYHSSLPDMQSTRSYNLLLRLAIRHSAFGIAHTLLQLMRASRVKEDLTTWKFCVRLLVREGRWSDAYNLVIDLPKDPSRAPFASGGVPVSVWAELLGTTKRRAFRDATLLRDPGMCNLTRYRHLMRQLPKLGISMEDTPPPQVVYASVVALIRMQQREAARQVTTRFLGVDPKGLGLRLVHLHVAADPRKRTLRTFYRALRDLQGFRVVCPELKPNSTTLFLLLGHLQEVKQCGIIGHKLVGWFRRQWGNPIVSPRVERRSLALAVKEKRVDLIRHWLTCVETSQKSGWMWSLEREVVDGEIHGRRSLSRRPNLGLGKAGMERLCMDRLRRRASRTLRSLR
ncbi:hypothetical protein EI94DRAFT_1785431 [Lactarius quietus]|nr:hypothetical protein EI94DRAFT_1785431 [Lactarius quietus]